LAAAEGEDPHAALRRARLIVNTRSPEEWEEWSRARGLPPLDPADTIAIEGRRRRCGSWSRVWEWRSAGRYSSMTGLQAENWSRRSVRPIRAAPPIISAVRPALPPRLRRSALPDGWSSSPPALEFRLSPCDAKSIG